VAFSFGVVKIGIGVGIGIGIDGFGFAATVNVIDEVDRIDAANVGLEIGDWRF
jgi:hypothetical protein